VDGSYVQNVELIGYTGTATASIRIGQQAVPMRPLLDYVAVSRHDSAQVRVESSDLVFVGYGVQAPEYDWDDYKGLDVSGKTVLILVGDPPIPDSNDSTQLDSAQFRGKAMTYYGRWTYKYEKASELGAAAAIIIHQTGPAGYPWEVVSGSWGGENLDITGADAYSIEILPESVRKKRDFAEGTAFLIAAAVLAVCFLGFYAWKSHGRLETISGSVSRLRASVNRVLGVDQDTKGLLEENEGLHAFSEQLFATAGSGEQIYRVLDAVDRHLPRDFWIEEFTSAWGFDDGLAVAKSDDRVPIVTIKGRAREGTETPTAQFEEFARGMRTALPAMQMKEQLGSTGSTFTITLTLLAPPKETP
jgi:hypothetical protein